MWFKSKKTRRANQQAGKIFMEYYGNLEVS